MDTTLTLGADVDEDSASLSGVASDGDHLYLAPDEGAEFVRLRRLGGAKGYGDAATFQVADFVPVPGAPGDEIDLEGLDIADGYLWMTGSHSVVRKRVPKHASAADVPRLLADIERPAARRLLARIPLPRDGTPADRTLHAASLADEGAGGLTALLSKDEHLGPFVSLPGKDNGLDIEGIAVVGPRVLLGLRGPVLRGWAVIVEIEPRASGADPTTLELAPMSSGGAKVFYIKHFLDLQGLGIRDLSRVGEDLLVLAGPTMVLDGPSRLLRLRGAGRRSLPEAVFRDDMEQVGADLAVGKGKDHPEAVTIVDTGSSSAQLLVVYDSPSKARLEHDGVRADLLPLS